MAYFSEQFVRQLRRRAALILTNHLFKPDVAEGIAASILWFNHAVRTKQVAVARVDL